MITAAYLSIGCGFQKAETIPEALAGQTELYLLLQDRGSALQNDLVILHPNTIKHLVTHFNLGLIISHSYYSFGLVRIFAASFPCYACFLKYPLFCVFITLLGLTRHWRQAFLCTKLTLF